MKLTLKMTMAAALVAASSSAFAILPSSATGVTGEGFPGGVAPTFTIQISGATAPDKAVNGLVKALCLPGSVTEFTDSCSTGGGTVANGCLGGAGKFPAAAYGAIMCQMSNAATSVPGMTAGTKNVLIRKRSDGGSYWGTSPVAFAVTNNKQMKLGSATCTATVANANQYICDKNATFSGTQAIADMGFSDLPPREFVGINVADGETECKGTCTGNLSAVSTFALGFGTPVTNALYIRLQKAQGLNTDVNGDFIDDATQKSLFHTGGTAAAFQAQFEANMPSLSKSQIAALMTGNIDRWSKVFYNNTALTDAAFGAEPTDDRVFVCRRVNGSGTQSTTNVNIMNAPCSPDAPAPAGDNAGCIGIKALTGGLPNVSADPACAGATWANPISPDISEETAVIHENSGSGDVDFCMNDLQNQGRLGIAVQSLEKNTASYSHIKIDGVSPTLANMSSGKYFNWGGVSIQWRGKTVNGIPPPTGDKLKVMNAIRNDAANPVDINALNQAAKQPFGLAGYLSLTNNNIKDFNALLPVMQWSNSGRSCAPMAPRDALGTGVGVDFGGI